MKIKNIAAICKKSKYVVLFNKWGESGEIIQQYIGDGSAIYPISGLPMLNEESILTIFDVPEKQRDTWFIAEKSVPKGISFDDICASEKPVEWEKISITYSGKVLRPIKTRCGIVFVEGRYLSPVSDVMDVLELYERSTESGMPYIVAKAGFLLQAVIMPYDIISDEFVDMLQELVCQCISELNIRKQNGMIEEKEERMQLEMDIDPETGDIMEREK